MVLPDDFNSFEFLQDIARKVLAREVREEFRDLGDGWDPDITTPRSALRTACTPDDNDTGVMLLIRLFFFYFQLRKAQDLQAPIYGIPTGIYHETFKFKPQVCLYFYEDLSDVEEGYQPIRSQISFRLIDESEKSITKAKLTTIANKIKQDFGLAGGYRFRRGRDMITYTDMDNGYKLRLFVFNKSEGLETIQRVLGLTNTTFKAENMNISENDNAAAAYPIIPPQETILGKRERLPRKRPVGTVRFSHATCSIWGKTKPVVLYSRTGILRGGLVD